MIVEDDADIAEMIAYNLRKEGYTTRIAESGECALRRIEEKKPDLILLDLMLPGEDGLEICRRLKQDVSTRGIPLIMVTAKSEDADVVTGLEIGADDYITKPFSPKILIARIRACIRRAHQRDREKEEPEIKHGDLTINLKKHEARCSDRLLSLTATEFRLLVFLARNAGWVLSRNQIIAGIKGDDYHVTDRSVDVLVFGLRKKMGRCDDSIETVRGVGYRMQEREV
jgi:two-component system phosphate regulon response regulator PhoB